MAFPIAIPFLPLFKVLLLGTLKFVFIAIGGLLAPVFTSNFLVRMSLGTPRFFSEHLVEIGKMTEEQHKEGSQYMETLGEMVNNPQKYQTSTEARTFLKKTAVKTVRSILESFVDLARRMKKWTMLVVRPGS